MKTKKWNCYLDFDDVLAPCNEIMLEMLEENTGRKHHLEEITKWDMGDDPISDRLKFVKTREFHERQKVYPGVHEFLKKLMKLCDVHILTAVSPECMGERVATIFRELPEIPSENIIMTSRKDAISGDFLLDDGFHNIRAAKVTYPVLLRKPWNKEASGGLSVNSLDEFLFFVESVIRGSIEDDEMPSKKIVVLMGPSGSGKTTVADELISLYPERFGKSVSHTTRKPRNAQDVYRFVSKEEFLKIKEEDGFVETTSYAGEYYGLTTREIFNVLDEGRTPILILDVCGAIALKSKFRDMPGITVKIIFVDRPKQDCFMSILERELPHEETARRLVTFDIEERNRDIADAVLMNHGNIRDAAEKLAAIAG